jgi:hypothetical protein
MCNIYVRIAYCAACAETRPPSGSDGNSDVKECQLQQENACRQFATQLYAIQGASQAIYQPVDANADGVIVKTCPPVSLIKGSVGWTAGQEGGNHCQATFCLQILWPVRSSRAGGARCDRLTPHCDSQQLQLDGLVSVGWTTLKT